MDRRQFLATGLGTAALAATGQQALGPQARAASSNANGSGFKLKYAPHAGHFKHSAGENILDQIRFAADHGFRGWEDNGLPNRDKKLQSRIGELLAKREMTMGVFVSFAPWDNADFVEKTDQAYQDHLRKEMRSAIEIAKRAGAKWTTVVPGNISQNLRQPYQMTNAAENLKVMAEVCEPAGLVMVLEPLNWWSNHPGKFLQTVAEGYQLCKMVNSPSCKILADLYHEQVQAGNLIDTMKQAWAEIAYIQMGDVPGRNEPLTGEVNYRHIFGWLYEQGYEGIVGMEHGKSQKGQAGEQRLLDAYHWCDRFDEPLI
jgi:hydroxypyruvate isomerase